MTTTPKPSEAPGHDDHPEPSRVVVSEATELDAALLAGMRRLLPQLSRSATELDRAQLEEIVASPSTLLLVAHDGGKLAGSLTLALFRIPTGVRAWIEDVVVDESARGRGVASALVRRAVDLAVSRGARSVDLTSRPSREAANRLYRRLGFELRETNVYRWSPEDPAKTPAG